MLLQTKYRNAEAVTIALLRQLGTPASARTIKNELFKHPGFPALQSLCDILPTFQLRAAVKKIAPAQLADIEAPFIAQTYHKGLVLVRQVNNDLVYTEGQNGRKKVVLKDFIDQIDGTVLITSPMLLNAGPSQKTTFRSEWALPAAIIGLGALLVAAWIVYSPFFSTLNSSIAALVIIKVAGVAINILLVSQTLGQQIPFVSRLCAVGPKTDCNSILTSKAAKITPWLSWSEVGLFYFSGTWLSLLLGGSSGGVWQTLMYLNMLCLPYTVWSIWYQYKIAGRWCILCCIVQVLLWLEFAVFMISLNWHLVPVINTTLIISLLVPVLLWAIIKQLWFNIIEKKAAELYLHFAKFNIGAFKQVLSQQSYCGVPDADFSIVLGNSVAPDVITIVTNPYCPACAIAHQQLTELLSSNQNLQARIIFIPDEDVQSKIALVGAHFISLYIQGGQQLVAPALHDWYQPLSPGFDEWAKEHPVVIAPTAGQIANGQREWCIANQIRLTPTIHINGYRLPEHYNLSDLKYLLNR